MDGFLPFPFGAVLAVSAAVGAPFQPSERGFGSNFMVGNSRPIPETMELPLGRPRRPSINAANVSETHL